VVLRNCT